MEQKQSGYKNRTRAERQIQSTGTLSDAEQEMEEEGQEQIDQCAVEENTWKAAHKMVQFCSLKLRLGFVSIQWYQHTAGRGAKTNGFALVQDTNVIYLLAGRLPQETAQTAAHECFHLAQYRAVGGRAYKVGLDLEWDAEIFANWAICRCDFSYCWGRYLADAAHGIDADFAKAVQLRERLRVLSRQCEVNSKSATTVKLVSPAPEIERRQAALQDELYIVLASREVEHAEFGRFPGDIVEFEYEKWGLYPLLMWFDDELFDAEEDPAYKMLKSYENEDGEVHDAYGVRELFDPADEAAENDEWLRTLIEERQ